MNILSLLADKGIIDPKQIGALEAEARSADKSIEEVLVKSGVSASDILQVEGEYYGLPVREIGEAKIPFEILRYIPEESAAYYRLVPLGIVDKVLEVGMVDPDNIEARDALNFIASKVGLPYKMFLISQVDFSAVLKQYRGISGEVGKALTELETELDVEEKKSKDTFDVTAPQEESISQADELTPTQVKGGAPTITEDAPVTKIVATILRYAIEGRASDIHIEAMVGFTRVRFRVDGALTTSLTLPAKVHQSVVARIKVLSNMRLDEKRKPQDGRFSAHVENQKVDFRVSTFPTYYRD
jgi:type IV pilus assembly protein PilB